MIASGFSSGLLDSTGDNKGGYNIRFAVQEGRVLAQIFLSAGGLTAGSVLHLVVVGLVGVLLLVFGFFGLHTGLSESLGGGVVDADTAGAAGLDDGGVDFVEGLFLLG